MCIRDRYIRPEIIGLVLGACIISLVKKEFRPRGGSAPVTRFTLGAFVMIGCLMFLGCPFRMILRLAGGDGNALFGLVGFVAGILTGTIFLKKGYTLKQMCIRDRINMISVKLKMESRQLKSLKDAIRILSWCSLT